MRFYSTTRPIRVCPVCGKLFQSFLSVIKKGGAQRCSIKCQAVARTVAPEQRFWKYVQRTDGCWLWTGRKPGGYGAFTVRKGDTRYAHRYMWELTNGPIPDGLWVLHKCDVPQCVNPAHLFLGTNADNTADRVAKGRSAFGDRNGARKYPERYVNFLRPDLPRATGERNSNAKLTGDTVREIRRMATQRIRRADIAALFNVHRETINSIVQRRTWHHID